VYEQSRASLKDYLSEVKAADTEPVKTAPGKSEVIGFFVDWEDTSFTSLKENIEKLDKLMPEWYHLTDGDGTFTQDNPARQELASAFIREHRPKLPVCPIVNNFNPKARHWEDQKLAQMLVNPDNRERAIQRLLSIVQTNNFAGVSIDFESVPDESQPDLIIFMKDLYNRFHALGLEVSESVPFDDEVYDYKELAKSNDFLILMAYDQHDTNGEPGPPAAQDWYATALHKRFADVPASKYVIAIGNYAYDWDDRTNAAKEYSYQDAIQTADESKGQITLDPGTLNPNFDYYDDNDALRHVWFLDAVTAFNQVAEAQKFGPHGYALWRLGAEDPMIWNVFERRMALDRNAAESLKTMRSGYDIDYRGRGEVLKVTSSPHDGGREISYDQTSGLITGQKVVSYPSPFVITRRGAKNPKKIALSFDDGPDARNTPKILDILKAYHVPATFFVIGLEADLNSNLLSRMLSEGHEIGNHTFTHPNTSIISQQQFGLELNATERLFESRLGRRSLLFRPPYAEDVEPDSPDQVAALEYTSKLGYHTIGMEIDPGDWKNPGVDQIVNATIDMAMAGKGNVVLLHDSGGDRSQTLAALPQIIKGLQDRGFELVTVSDLIGLSRDSVMPQIAPEERITAGLNDAGFIMITGLSTVIRYLFMIGIVLGIMRLVFVIVLAVGEWWRWRHSEYPADYTPSVTVLIPAYNEEKVIARSVEALLNSDYPNFEILIIDDGSTDRTYDVVMDSFGNDNRVTAYRIKNGGKAAALLYGVHRSNAEIIVALDADTIFEKDAVSKLVRHFADSGVGAVAGNAKVGNRINLLTRWQALEYITSQNLDRRAFDALNCISVVPGAIGAWRRDLIIEAGGFADDTLAEDTDLTLTILKLGYEINYEEEAIAYTEAPDTIKGFVKQRFRWMFGTLQAVWKHLDALFRPKYGSLGLLAIPNVLIFQILFPLISPIMDLMMVASLLGTFWAMFQHPNDYSTDTLRWALFYYSLFLLIEVIAALVAFLLEPKEDRTLLIWLLLQRFCYRQLMYYVAIKSTIAAIRGSFVSWGKLERKATVQ
jgi:cellulose synthase/poly-beta-1,6-N-acetylglucosamine synthase-like glycosyltransferase/peptidoglycan/xylan/chitin deacetylase (PgdA/CDA1 family)/spore germination protein YaaH